MASADIESSRNKNPNIKSETMPSRKILEDDDGVNPSKPRGAKNSKRTPADPPGLATDAVPRRSAPRRSKSDSADDKKIKAKNSKKAVSRTKSSSATDGDDRDALQPPVPVRRQSSGMQPKAGEKKPMKSGKVQLSPSSKKGVVRTASASPAAPLSPKKGVSRTYSASAASTAPPKSPIRRSYSSQISPAVNKNAPKSPSSILKPASYKVTAQPAKSASSKPKSLTSMDSKPTAKSKDGASRSSQNLGNATSTNKINSVSKNSSSHRSQLVNELAAQESKILSKSGKDAPGASSSPQQQRRQAPGAYLVQGQNVARASTGMLSPHAGNAFERSSSSKQGSSQSRRKNGEPPLENAPPVVAGSVQSPDLVVAAELSEDVESQIEEQVRQRLLQNTVRANVVSVVHGKTLYDPEVEAKRLADLREMHKPKGMKEKLFGDTRNADIDIAASPECIMKRTYLKWSVRRNPATNLWVASVQTSQKAVETNDTIEIERNTLSFSATTQQEAFETGLANATPLLHPPEQHPICHVCKAKFAIFRRPVHCRNCGVCVCSSCSTTWPSKMLPDSYNTKNSSVTQVCLACDFLANSFRDALVEGDFRSVQHLYATGNVNLRTPFCLDRKAEVMYPIHLAILGGNVKIVKWLCSERYCPLRMPKKRGKKEGPILTSKNRSPLGIALLHQRLDIVRYLVADMGVSLFEEKDMNTNMALANFTSLLKMLPESAFEGKKMVTTAVPSSAVSSPRSFDPDNLSPSASARRRPSL